MVAPFGRRETGPRKFEQTLAERQKLLHGSFAKRPLADHDRTLWSCKQAATISAALALFWFTITVTGNHNTCHSTFVKYD